ncbi:hypothetical protein GCM10025872_30370 [Barrientosiimonas endolithica]|uniref:N-acetyltransferase domain-containing protein n=1 Tax=Barrientosiimonas endolithica TaxID=1535208 RepID=A0ABM8HEH6_9MICO|nr:hypothetical protein GCM10025872_30370 [Barrientosiimonas endolithica]
METAGSLGEAPGPARPLWLHIEVATSIRAATADDIDSLVNLESRLFESDAGVHDPAVDKTWPQRKGRADFENLLSETKSLVLVASDGPDVYGHLVGWVSKSSDVRRGQVIGYVRSLFVDEHLRRRHLAHDLLD